MQENKKQVHLGDHLSKLETKMDLSLILEERHNAFGLEKIFSFSFRRILYRLLQHYLFSCVAYLHRISICTQNSIFSYLKTVKSTI